MVLDVFTNDFEENDVDECMQNMNYVKACCEAYFVFNTADAA